MTEHKEFRLTIGIDEFSEHLNPNNEDRLFKLHSFNRRHNNFTDPDVLLACQREISVDTLCEWGLAMHGDDSEDLIDHAYEGPEGYLLSYFEHGLCRWFLAHSSNTNIPDFQWDGVMYAGFLEVTVPDNEREWWNSQTEEWKREAAESFCEEYTEWANGNVYGFILERVGGETCSLGYFHEETQEEDSCWGFIGFEHFQEEVRGATGWMGATEANTEVIDKAYGMAQYGDFFTGHHWTRSRITEEVSCQKCRLFPVGPEDYDTKCEKEYEEVSV